MRTVKNQTKIILMLLLFFSCGCAGLKTTGTKIEKGDKVFLDVTCRLPDQSVIFTTEPDIAKDPSIPKSRVFRYPNMYENEGLTAGLERDSTLKRKYKKLELEIYYQLSQQVIGFKRGTYHEVKLNYTLPEEVNKADSIQTWPRKVTVNRIRTTSRYNFDRGYGDPPEVGTIRKIQDGRDWTKIVAVDDKTVTYELLAKDGDMYETMWGDAIVRINGDKFTTDIQAKVGTLIWWNGLVGKIVDFSDKTIFVDFGHPYAGHELTCDVNIRDEVKDSEDQQDNHPQ